VVLAVTFLTQTLPFGDCLEVSGVAGSPLDKNQPVQVKTPYVTAEQLRVRRMRLQLLEPSATGKLAEQIKISERRGQGEVQTALDRIDVQEERKAFGSASPPLCRGVGRGRPGPR
jgi:hypothetical protein